MRTQTFVVGNLKGGSGKTTTAVLLALALLQVLLRAMTGRRRPLLLLIDCDPEQPQASEWAGQARQAKRWPAEVHVLHVPTRDVRRTVAEYMAMLDTSGVFYDVIIFDVGPKNPSMLGQALRSAADLGDGTVRLVIPCQATGGDIRELPKVLQLAAEVDAELPADAGGVVPQVLLTRVRKTGGALTGSGEEADARRLLAGENTPTMRTCIRQLRRYAVAFGSAPTADRDLADYADLATEVTAA
jgi:chromosome partitioning protein